jgi:hypothetical protein
MAASAASAVKTLVDKLIKDNIVMVFSKSYCPYCSKAKNVFASFGAALKSYKVSLRATDCAGEAECDLI